MSEGNLKLDFCLKFNYPEEIQELLRKIIEVLGGKDTMSIIALGSLPKGELSYRVKNGRLELFSDIDIAVVTQAAINAEERILFIKRLKELKSKFQPTNPLFNISVEFFSLQDFMRLPFKVRFYELKASGKTLFGKELRDVIPDFSFRNLDMEDTNNMILRRLLHILLYLPRELFEKKGNDPALDVFKYTLARNSLDIATAVLFQKGVLLSTYKEKVDYIVSKSDNFIGDFGPGFPSFLTRCLKIKLEIDSDYPPADLFKDALGYFGLVLAYILKNNGIDPGKKGSLSSLARRSKDDIFGEKDITRTKFDFILKSPNLNLLLKRLNSLSFSFLGCTLFFVLNIDKSACLFLEYDRRSLSVLDDSWWALMKLGVLSSEDPLPIGFVDRFLVLREKFFLDFYVKFMAPDLIEPVTEALNWKYE